MELVEFALFVYGAYFLWTKIKGQKSSGNRSGKRRSQENLAEVKEEKEIQRDDNEKDKPKKPYPSPDIDL